MVVNDNVHIFAVPASTLLLAASSTLDFFPPANFDQFMDTPSNSGSSSFQIFQPFQASPYMFHLESSNLIRPLQIWRRHCPTHPFKTSKLEGLNHLNAGPCQTQKSISNMRSVLRRRYKFSHPPVAALSEGDFLSGWWKWRSSCKGGRNRSKERLEWLEKASNPRQLYFVRNDGNVHFLLSSIVEYILPHISTSCFLVTQDLKDLRWAKMMCISVSVISPKLRQKPWGNVCKTVI